MKTPGPLRTGKTGSKSGNEPLTFLREYLRNPRGVGSITPSGPQLTELVVKSLALKPGDTVVELGPGTGVFTQALLNAGVDPQHLLLVELSSEFATHLASRFPAVCIEKSDAAELPQVLKRAGIGQVSKIVSGLPFRSMKRESKQAIVHAIAESLVPGGLLSQFSYLTGVPISRDMAERNSLLGARFGVALGNVPPAFVWRYVKMV